MHEESATEVLRYEHRLILRVADALEKAIATPDPAESDFELLTECIAFFRLFADACHHAKEETLLFAELEESGMPRHEGPIAVMLDEHRMARHLVRKMAGAVHAARSDDNARALLRKTAFAYIDLIRSHIGKEDGVLFEIADGAIRGPQCERLCAAYRETDACGFESRSKAELELIAERIIARAG